MDRKGSYFFVIDAFIAAIIVSSTIVVLFSSFSESASERESFYAAEDFLVLLESTQVRDFESDMVRSWVTDGTINDTMVSILQQIALFNATGRRDEAEDLANLTLVDIPPHVSARIIVSGEVYAEQAVIPDVEADVFFTSKRILLVRQTKTDLYPPIILEVQTWQ